MKHLKLLELGHKIKFERMKQKMSQENLAEKSNLSVHTISDIERGSTDIRYTNLLQIAEAFEVPIGELLTFNL